MNAGEARRLDLATLPSNPVNCVTRTDVTAKDTEAANMSNIAGRQRWQGGSMEIEMMQTGKTKPVKEPLKALVKGDKMGDAASVNELLAGGEATQGL